VNITPVANGITVTLPDNTKIQASHTGLLDLPHLPLAARVCHIFPKLKNKVLLAIGQFCDSGYQALFTATQLLIFKDGEVHIQGARHQQNGLWYVDLQNQKQTPMPPLLPVPCFPALTGHLNNVYELTTKQQIVVYYHKACFSPVPSTWIKAIDAGFFATWPGLTSALVRNHLPKSEATCKGHMRTTRTNVRSTKPQPLLAGPSTDAPAVQPFREKECYLMPIDVSGKVYTDQTGRFPKFSSKGSKYLMVLYDFDTNAILAEPLKNKTAAEQLRATTVLHNYLQRRGFHPQFHIMDNECPITTKNYLHDSSINFQLVPPHLHRTNAAEKAIGTFKDHFIAGLCSVNPNFPMHLWCRLIPLAVTTLNLLRPARINPRLSAEAILNGAFDYNRTPLAPPGTKVIVHENPTQRKTWAAHGIDGWYVGAAPEHYRCHRTYIPETRQERIGRTVEFFPHNFAMPALSSADAATAAARDLIFALEHPGPASPFGVVAPQAAALRRLADLFLHHTTPASPTPAVSPRVALQPPTAPAARVGTQHQPAMTPAAPFAPTRPDGPALILDDDAPTDDGVSALAKLVAVHTRAAARAASQGPHLIPPLCLFPRRHAICSVLVPSKQTWPPSLIFRPLPKPIQFLTNSPATWKNTDTSYAVPPEPYGSKVYPTTLAGSHRESARACQLEPIPSSSFVPLPFQPAAR
jgi:hypothetical protein